VITNILIRIFVTLYVHNWALTHSHSHPHAHTHRHTYIHRNVGNDAAAAHMHVTPLLNLIIALLALAYSLPDTNTHKSTRTF